MTEKEKKEFKEFFYWSVPENVMEWMEKKKKEWQEMAVAEYRLKREVETKFYGDGL
jgi:hypothetical protein